MASMKAIKTRIKSVESTRQITKAMELVATSKLRHAKARIEHSRPYFEILRQTLDDIALSNRDFSSPFCRVREGAVCHIVIAGDRGLAGGYNNNLFKSVQIASGDLVFPIGRKAVEHFDRLGATLFTRNYDVTEDVSIADCYAIGQSLVAAYRAGQFTKLRIYYTSFVNVLTQIPVADDILPIAIEGEVQGRSLILYEPDPETVFDRIVPQYIAGITYGALSESLASELSARRSAMESANKNADEMIDSLSLQYNRARQAAITQEITEIVAGAK